MKTNQKTGKIVILSLLLILFGFILWFFFSQYFDIEGFKKNINISNRLDIGSALEFHEDSKLNRINKKEWWNSYTLFEKENKNITAKNIIWNNLNWTVHPSQISSKNQNFTLSFWIYVNDNPEETPQPIFRIIDPENNTDRLPGVFLISSKEEPILSIRCKTESNSNDGKTSENEKIDCTFPAKKPICMTIVFKSDGYTLFMNGEYVTSYKWNPIQMKSDKSILELVHPASKDSFFVHNLSIYEKPFNAKEVYLLYNTQNVRKPTVP